MKAEIKVDAIPGIVSMVSDNEKMPQQSSSARYGCYEACDASGCDCFDSGDCFDACDRAPDPARQIKQNK